jgi:hypothetical protein
LSRFDWVTAPPTTRDEWHDAEEVVPVHAWPLTADIVGSYVRSHDVAPQDLPDLVHSVLTALMNAEFPAPDAARKPDDIGSRSDAQSAPDGGRRGRMSRRKANQEHTAQEHTAQEHTATSWRRAQGVHAAE